MTNLIDDPPKKHTHTHTTIESSEVLASTPKGLVSTQIRVTLDCKNRAKLKASVFVRACACVCVCACVFENLVSNSVGRYAIEFDQPVEQLVVVSTNVVENIRLAMMVKFARARFNWLTSSIRGRSDLKVFIVQKHLLLHRAKDNQNSLNFIRLDSPAGIVPFVNVIVSRSPPCGACVKRYERNARNDVNRMQTCRCIDTQTRDTTHVLNCHIALALHLL